MASASVNKLFPVLFGSGKGSGAAMVMFILGVAGTVICLGFGRILQRYEYTDKE